MIKTRVGVLISARGSNMMALVEAARRPDYPAEIVCVVSNRADAAGLKFAATQGFATKVVDHRLSGSQSMMHDYLLSHGVEIVALAGFMRILSPAFVKAWKGRILNIHPSLLPAYRGLHTHERALADGARVHGCTVHLVTEGLDEGPAIMQAEVPVLAGDTPDSLAARVLTEEHRIYPEALAQLARQLQAKTST